jgi:hypothetical protein
MLTVSSDTPQCLPTQDVEAPAKGDQVCAYQSHAPYVSCDPSPVPQPECPHPLLSPPGQRVKRDKEREVHLGRESKASKYERIQSIYADDSWWNPDGRRRGKGHDAGRHKRQVRPLKRVDETVAQLTG